MNTEYQTKDLHLAAYLKLKGAEFLRCEKTETQFKAPSFFIFADKDKCRSLEKMFWETGDFINITEYMAIVKDLRSRVSSIPYAKKD